MNCAYHQDREVRAICSSCGRPVCAECLVELSGQPYCKACLTARVQRPVREINGFVRFILSIAPGFGHLYMGLVNRGLQFFVGTILGGILLAMLIPVLLPLYIAAAIFFSIFDAREAHLRMAQGLEVPDQGFVDLKNLSTRVGHREIGWGLIILGALALWRVVSYELARLIWVNRWWEVRAALNGMALGIVFVAAGIWLLRRNQVKRG